MKRITNKIWFGKFNILLTGMCLFCITLFVFRSSLTHTIHYSFLIWNLFLAGIPWILSLAMVGLKNRKIFLKIILFIPWLLFFPNSLYIFTDLFHLRNETSFPIWYDFILITSFAWTGLVMGFAGLMNIKIIFTEFLPANVINYILTALLFVGSFGVYIGRYLRWNSWDLVTHPFSLMFDLKERIVHPAIHTRTWGMTILMGLLLNMMYWTYNYAMKYKQNKI